MTREYNRIQRIAKEIQKGIATILQYKIKNPHFCMITVSKVNLSRDLSYAKVFVTFLDRSNKEQININIQTLQGISGLIRSLLGKTIFLRIIPELNFVYDNSLVDSMRMYNLIDQTIQNDFFLRSIKNTDETYDF